MAMNPLYLATPSFDRDIKQVTMKAKFKSTEYNAQEYNEYTWKLYY